MSMDYNELLALPKVELHLHLDCSLSYDVVKKLKPEISTIAYKDQFIAPEKCKNLADFLKCTTSGIELMQTKQQIRLVVADLFAQLQSENVIYAEIRFAPHQHVKQGLAVEEVVQIVSDSVSENSASTGIKAGVILCTLRHYAEEQSLQTVKLVQQFSGSHIVGFDIAADEAGFPIDAHKASFEYAVQHDIPRTAHAGEAAGAESVWETLTHFQPQRIGHGVRSIEDAKLIEHLAEHNIHLEVCPTCNIQTDIYDDYGDHPIDFLYNAGISVGINTDARSLSNVNLTQEYEKLVANFGWKRKHFFKCNMAAMEAAFLSESEKKELAYKLVRGY